MLPLIVLLCLAGSTMEAMDVQLRQTSAGPLKVGAAVAWTAEASGSLIEYQFSVAMAGQGFSVVRDFSNRSAQFEWTPMQEGSYRARVVARQNLTGESASAEADFVVASRVGAGGEPVVSATANPLVFLYSAPPCDARAMSVDFVKLKGLDEWTMTDAKVCDGRTSMNFWIAGLEANSDYSASYRVWNDMGGPVYDGPQSTFRTGAVTAPLPAVQVLRQDKRYMDLQSGLLLQSTMITPAPGAITGALPIAHKLDGTVVWYYDAKAHGVVNNLLRPIKGGVMLLAAQGGIRAIDLAGNTIWEANPEATSTRLAAMGRPPVGNFHHDALVLPNGTILALTSSQRRVPGATPNAPVRNVIGDVLLLLDRDFNIRWVWDSFEKLDVNRKAVLGELQGQGADASEDWTHGNALQYLSDGNILFSIRHMDWVIKIDFQDGMGSGDLIWRMGKDGDFQVASNDPYPWFSHQHDPHFDGVRLWVYDNGNTRYEAQGQTGNSRGQVYLINEDARIATLQLNADLGVLSLALGSAQLLRNGNYHFLSGNLLDLESQSFASQSTEVSPDSMDGPIRYIFQARSATYRSFRLTDLYRPSAP